MPAISLSSSAAVSSATMFAAFASAPVTTATVLGLQLPTSAVPSKPCNQLRLAATASAALGSDIWLLLTTTPSPSESGGGWYYPPPNGYSFPAPPPPFPILPYFPYYYYTPPPSDFMNSSVPSAKHFVFVTLHPFEQGEEKGTA
ncbi:hypothetical protein RHGRI_021220 [Rhododendron griersonianum]|uniref:Uncharacterized protein n=1 Tax=Rhododendron griersonianum TaxID=479676 RepID=A0AAV6JMJ8_9ERIC|nr:hypothetical protein RHGRI_021220 [Rhododendron griersonianum]